MSDNDARNHSRRIQDFQAFRNPVATLSVADGQARRRQEALDRQRAQRQHAFSLTRQGLEDVLEDLSLSEDEAPVVAVSETAEGDVDTGKSVREANPSKRRRNKRRWRGYADKLMMGEELELDGGLPHDLFENWIAMGPIPKGKRCLVVSFASTKMNKKGRVTNTILLARSSGRPLGRHYIPVLPPDCILDCIYLKDAGALFVLDVMNWRGQSIAECDTEFRMFWRNSKFDEMPAQLVAQTFEKSHNMATDGLHSSDETQRPGHLVIATVSAYTSPLSCELLLKDCVRPIVEQSAMHATYSSLPIHPLMSQSTQQSSIQYEADGLLLMVKSASYESGLTPLAAWVPKTSIGQFGDLLART